MENDSSHLQYELGYISILPVRSSYRWITEKLPQLFLLFFTLHEWKLSGKNIYSSKYELIRPLGEFFHSFFWTNFKSFFLTFLMICSILVELSLWMLNEMIERQQKKSFNRKKVTFNHFSRAVDSWIKWKSFVLCRCMIEKCRVSDNGVCRVWKEEIEKMKLISELNWSFNSHSSVIGDRRRRFSWMTMSSRPVNDWRAVAQSERLVVWSANIFQIQRENRVH